MEDEERDCSDGEGASRGLPFPSLPLLQLLLCGVEGYRGSTCVFTCCVDGMVRVGRMVDDMGECVVHVFVVECLYLWCVCVRLKWLGAPVV